MSCSVFGCYNSPENTKDRVPKVSFYRFPAESKDRERRRVWIRFASRKK